MYQGFGDTIPVVVSAGDYSATANLPSGAPGFSICSAAGCEADVANLLAGMTQEESALSFGNQVTTWLSANSTLVLVGAAVFVGALFLSGGSRRR
jgi:hypothetical protein